MPRIFSQTSWAAISDWTLFRGCEIEEDRFQGCTCGYYDDRTRVSDCSHCAGRGCEKCISLARVAHTACPVHTQAA
jgi:hypothetical protein